MMIGTASLLASAVFRYAQHVRAVEGVSTERGLLVRVVS